MTPFLVWHAFDIWKTFCQKRLAILIVFAQSVELPIELFEDCCCNLNVPIPNEQTLEADSDETGTAGGDFTEETSSVLCISDAESVSSIFKAMRALSDLIVWPFFVISTFFCNLGLRIWLLVICFRKSALSQPCSINFS